MSTSFDSPNSFLKEFLKTWNLVHASTQTEETELPLTSHIEHELAYLKAQVEYQTSFIQLKNKFTLQSKLEHLKTEFESYVHQLEQKNAIHLTRCRTASNLELKNYTRAMEGHWKQKYTRIENEWKLKFEQLQTELNQTKKKLKILQMESAEEVVQTKAALARAYAWISKNYGEATTKELQEHQEEEINVIVQLQRKLAEKDELILKLQRSMIDSTMVYATPSDSVSSLNLSQSSTYSFSSSNSKPISMLRSKRVPFTGIHEQEEVALSSNSNIITMMTMGSSEEKEKLKIDLEKVQEADEEFDVIHSNPSTTAALTSTFIQDPSSTNEPIQLHSSKAYSTSTLASKDVEQRASNTKMTRALMDDLLKKVETTYTLKLEKAKLIHETEISNLKKTLEMYKQQLEAFKSCLQNFLDPSKVAIIMARQRALLELASKAKPESFNTTKVDEPNSLEVNSHLLITPNNLLNSSTHTDSLEKVKSVKKVVGKGHSSSRAYSSPSQSSISQTRAIKGRKSPRLTKKSE